MWKLADGTDAEIVNFLDDYSRVAVASKAFRVTTAPRVLEVFRSAADIWGLPAALLTDIHPEFRPDCLFAGRPAA